MRGSVVIDHAGRALCLLNALADLGHLGAMATWRPLADPAHIADTDGRAAVAVAFAAGMESIGPDARDAAATPRSWWPALVELVGGTWSDMATEGLSLPAVRRVDLEPVDWSARWLLWMLALAFAEREKVAQRHAGDAG
jgi:hypothetical protein